jgi:energy-coupling factor transporter ATP-binding protein EcfA2
MSVNQSQIKDSQVRENLKNAYNALVSSNYAPASSNNSPRIGRRPVSGSSHGHSTSFSILENIKSITEDNPLMTDKQHHVVTVLQEGLALAAAVIDTYKDISGFGQLLLDNSKGILNSDQKNKFIELKTTHAYIAVFTVANYVQAKLDNGQANLSAVELSKPVLMDSGTSTKAFLYDLNEVILKCVTDDVNLGPAIKAAALSYIESLRTFEIGLSFTESFTGNHYRSEMLDFDINGFELAGGARKQSLTMQFKKPEEVIGNRIAKYQMKKLAKMMMCYDPATRKNPFVELGGFIFTFMGDGAPGTGKTTLIQMLCGLLNDYCQIAGREFYYENFSIDQVDSFQGKSGQNAKQFINNVLNPNVIGFGTVDDIDQIAGKRGDKQSSGGQQEVTAVLMESLAGANTVINGNATIGMFTNYPENVDDALRQRCSARYLVDGPQTVADYTDLLALLVQSRSNIEVGDADLFSTQQIEGAIETSYEVHNIPETKELKDIYDKAISELGEIDTLAKFGRYLNMIKEAEPRFTGRAIKNIADAAKLRAMDIDLPDEWFETADTFMNKSYDEKLEMISSKAGTVTPTILLQELHRYADSEFRYSANSDQAEVDKYVRDHNVRIKAQEAINKQ